MEIGERIRQYREKAGMPQAQLANSIHVSPSYMNRIEKGTSTPSIELICSVAKALNITPQDILCDIFVYDQVTLSTSEKIAFVARKFSPETQSFILDMLEFLYNRSH